MFASTPIPGIDDGLVASLLAADLPVDDIGDPGRSFFRVEHDGRVLGYGGFELYGEDALLRSIVVPAANRGRGHGRFVAEAMLREIDSAGGRRAYLLTTTAAAFFEHLGFRRIGREAAPPTILATRQASTICTSADLLTKAI
jgi:N-acetylglutamate synthase-like GNAT family acetyltransferase